MISDEEITSLRDRATEARNTALAMKCRQAPVPGAVGRRDDMALAGGERPAARQAFRAVQPAR